MASTSLLLCWCLAGCARSRFSPRRSPAWLGCSSNSMIRIESPRIAELQLQEAGGGSMPEKRIIERARQDAREGKAPSTQAGEFVREEMEHIREGKHGARSTKQAIAIGLSKARRAGVKLPPPKEGEASEETRTQATRNYAQGQKSPDKKPSPTRSRATTKALKREGTKAASSSALSRQASASARSRGPADRRRAAQKAVRTKGSAGLRSAARKAALTRSRNR
jgi:hypothetical protein